MTMLEYLLLVIIAAMQSIDTGPGSEPCAVPVHHILILTRLGIEPCS